MKCVFRAVNIKRSPEERAAKIIKLHIATESYHAAVTKWMLQHQEHWSNLKITLEVFTTAAQEQINFYWIVRDTICEHSGDTSKEYKKHMDESLRQMYGAIRNDGEPKHIDEYTKEELWYLTESAISELENLGGSLESLRPYQRDAFQKKPSGESSTS